MKKKSNLTKKLFTCKVVFAMVFMLFQSYFMLGEDNTPELLQQKKVTLNIKEENLSNVIQTIINQSGSEIIFFNSQTSPFKCRNIQLNSVSVDKALEEVLKGSRLTFKVQNGKYVILDLPQSIPDNDRKNKGIVVSGIVTDSFGEPLPAATVIIKGTEKGTCTNINGEYQITVPGVDTYLQFIYMGMETKEVRISSETNVKINVSLKEKENILKEITFVSTGYQKVSRRDMVGALATVNADDILMMNYSSIDQMLQGVVPGMIVTNTSSRVGTSPSIQIRGTSTLLGDSQPLWVVDGIIQEDPIKINAVTYMSDDIKNIIGNQVSWLNPRDIENITVLKDASSTAIYGSKASNGVIVITTKQAKGGQERLSVNYNASMTINSSPNYGLFNLMNSQERLKFSDEAFASGVPYSAVPLYDNYSYEGLKRLYIEGYITESTFKTKREFLETSNTDWLKLLTRTGFNQNHNLSMMGNFGKTNYSTSVSYSKQQGQEIGNDNERFTGRISLGMRLNNKMRLNVSLTGSYTKNTGFGQGVSPMLYALQTSRAIPAYDEEGNLAYYQKSSSYKYNKLVPSLGYNILNERDQSSSFTQNMRVAASADFTWNLLSWLSYNFTGGYNFANNAMESYLSEQTFSVANEYRGYDFGTALPESDNFKAATMPFGGVLFTNDARQTSYNIQNKFAINKIFRSVDRLNILLGHELRSGTNQSTANTAWGYSIERGETIIQPPIPSEVIPTAGSVGSYTGFGILGSLYSQRWRRLHQTNNFMSLFATLAYSIENKYVVNASIRNDFSNRFGQDVNKRIDPIYSFGVSWKIAEERIIKNNLNFLSQFNVRLTYGIQGNALTNESPELILYKQAKKAVFDQYFSTISKIPNPNLTWERTTNWNFGADIQLFNKVSLVVDYYTRRSNAILSQDIPYEFGISSTTMNGGIIHNKGIEGTLSFAPVNKRDMGLSISLNSSKNWNTTGPVVGTILLANYLNGKSGAIIKEGYPLSGFWSYSFAGLDPSNGTPVFNLMDTPAETAKDDPTSFLVYSGERDHSFSGGLSLNFRYKTFSIGTGFALMLGGKKRLTNPYSNFSSGSKLPLAENNISKTLNDRWMKSGDELFTNIPGLSAYNSSLIQLPNGINTAYPLDIWALSSAMVADASFLRCKNIDLNWRISEKFLSRLNISSLTITASLNNVFVIASERFNGFDPELSESVLPKSYSLGLSIGF